MKTPMIQHSIKITAECKNAIDFLKTKHISSDKYLRLGGERLVIEIAQKNKFELVKLKLSF